MKAVLLGGKKAAGRVAIVDDDDYESISSHSWRLFEKVHPNRRVNGPYAMTDIVCCGRKTGIVLHKLLTGWPQTDHINHDGLDNRRANLRPATSAQNQHNTRPCFGHSSQYKGVSWHRQCRKWQASIKANGKFVYLGVFALEEDAARAYNTAALEAYGSYTYLNQLPGEGRAA